MWFAELPNYFFTVCSFENESKIFALFNEGNIIQLVINTFIYFFLNVRNDIQITECSLMKMVFYLLICNVYLASIVGSEYTFFPQAIYLNRRVFQLDEDYLKEIHMTSYCVWLKWAKQVAQWWIHFNAFCKNILQFCGINFVHRLM